MDALRDIFTIEDFVGEKGMDEIEKIVTIRCRDLSDTVMASCEELARSIANSGGSAADVAEQIAVAREQTRAMIDAHVQGLRQ